MKRGNFFMVDNDVFRYKLSPIAFYVYCYLLRCNSSKRGCYPSKRTIAEGCGIAVSSVSKALKLLKLAALSVYGTILRAADRSTILMCSSQPSVLRIVLRVMMDHALSDRRIGNNKKNGNCPV